MREARPEISVRAESGRSALIRAVHSPETVRFETRAIVRRGTRHGCRGSKGGSGAVTRLCVWIGGPESHTRLGVSLKIMHGFAKPNATRKKFRSDREVACVGAMQAVTNGGLGARALPLEVDEGASARIPDCKLSQFELPDVTTFLMQIDNISRL
jgi:hypothetical protein